MAKKKTPKITEKALEKAGRMEFTHTDSYGITYEMTLFWIGMAMNGRVLAPDGTLIFHNERSYDDFKTAKAVWDATCKTMTDENNAVHKKYADMAAKASFTNNRETIHEQPSDCSAVANSAIGISQPENRRKPTAEPTLADQLREALLRQMRKAA